MGFGINGDDLPFIRNYARARAQYDSTKPVRGTNNVRPLGDRRKKHQRIEEAPRNGAGAAGLACVLYHTACVTYYEDGTMHLNHGHHISQSTCKFINLIAPVTHVRIDAQRDCLVVCVAGGEYKCGAGGLWLKQNETGGYVPIDPEPFMVTMVDRAAMREAKKQYKPFMTYAVGLGKLTQWEHPTGEGVPVNTGGLLELMLSDDMEHWAMAYRKMLWEAGVYQHNYDYTARHWEDKWVCDKKRLDAHLTHMVKQVYAHLVLVREALPLGEHKKDPNYRYVGYIRRV